MSSSSGDQVIKISFHCDEKKSKQFINLKVLRAVCALLNSSGGKIEISTKATIDKRSIEQIITTNLLGNVEFVTHVDVRSDNSDDSKIFVFVKKRKDFTTVKYNLCLPTQKQILEVNSTDNVDRIRHILDRSIVEDPVSEDSRIKRFVLGEPSGLEESDVVQLKNLKDAKTSTNKKKETTFATRMLSEKNKLCYYVSGFANHRGGHIYYGIADEGVVSGEKLTEQDVKEVEDEVSKAMEKLIWTERKEQPKKGTHWEIHFENVKDKNDKTVDSIYVVVVYIAFCCGGVFTAEPESYYINKEGKDQKMEFSLWWKSFRYGAFSTLYTVVHTKWSSETNQRHFIKLSELLVEFRDKGDYESFNKLCKLADTKFKHRDGGLIVLAGRNTIAYKNGDIELAKTYLKEYENLLSTVEDPLIFETRLLLSQSLVARREEKYKESYDKSKEGLQLAQNIPPGLCLLWLYLECAMNAACQGSKNEGDVEFYREMKGEALAHLEGAARVADALKEGNVDYRINDFQHKSRIYKAWVLINCSVTGKAASVLPSEAELEAACEEVNIVHKTHLNGKMLSKMREVEYHLVQCDIFTRRSEIQNDKSPEKNELLQKALQEADIAKSQAENDFHNLLTYANARLDALRKSLNSTSCETDENTVRTFEGFAY